MALLAIIATRYVAGMFTRGKHAVVTGEAAADDLCMINQRDRIPTCRAMAVLADVGGLYVGRMFSGGVDAVMATEAAARYVGMVECGRLPRAGLVTVVAPVAGNDVVERLARRDNIVMAVAATAGYGSMIHERDRAPRTGRMAVAADLRALDVMRILARRLDCADRRMAADAVRACAFEPSPRVTAFARDVDMGAVEIEASTEMIERLLAERRCRSGKREAERNHQGMYACESLRGGSHHRILLTSLNDSGE